MKTYQQKIISVSLLIVLALGLMVQLFSFSQAATRTFRVQETDFVKIIPEAIDEDMDDITFTFSEPLDNKGEWQTDFGDEGEYEVEITISDGTNEIIEYVLIIVEDKNQAPELTAKRASFEETETIDLKQFVRDPDNDVLTYSFDTPFDDNGEWTTNYQDAGTYTVSFTVDDTEFNVVMRMEITVANKNEPPMIVDVFSTEKVIEIQEGETLEFYATASDNDASSQENNKESNNDNDELQFLWFLDGNEISSESSGQFYFDYSSEGKHDLELIVDDGKDEVSQGWEIDVENFNREPEFSLEPIAVNENELIDLNSLLPIQDQDGDDIEYEFSAPLDESGQWQTTYDDEGTYNIRVVASDGNKLYPQLVMIEVLNVDRAPELSLPQELIVRENELLEWEIDATDPDSELVTVSINNLPEGAELEQPRRVTDSAVFIWQPSYDEISRSYSALSKMLNFMKLEHYFLREKTINLELQVCSKDLCTNGIVPLTVKNVNRAPILDNIPDIIVMENDNVVAYPNAYDLDGDRVAYSFTSPLAKKAGVWQTDYEDEGIYTSYVIASDGKDTAIKPVQIQVGKANRAPVLSTTERVVVNEGEEFTLHLSSADLDNDDLELSLNQNLVGASLSDNNFVWTPPYNTVIRDNNEWRLWNKFAGLNNELNKQLTTIDYTETLEFTAFDGQQTTTFPVEVVIKNVNRGPEIIDYLPEAEIYTEVNKPVVFHVVTKDPDNDPVTVIWDVGFTNGRIVGTDTLERTFVEPGVKKISAIATDRLESTKKTWTVYVADNQQQQIFEKAKQQAFQQVQPEENKVESEQKQTVQEKVKETSKQSIVTTIFEPIGATLTGFVDVLISQKPTQQTQQPVQKVIQQVKQQPEPKETFKTVIFNQPETKVAEFSAKTFVLDVPEQPEQILIDDGNLKTFVIEQ